MSNYENDEKDFKFSCFSVFKSQAGRHWIVHKSEHQGRRYEVEKLVKNKIHH